MGRGRSDRSAAKGSRKPSSTVAAPTGSPHSALRPLPSRRTAPGDYRSIDSVTRGETTLSFGSHKGGIQAHDLSRRVRTSGATGPWSETASATVAALRAAPLSASSSALQAVSAPRQTEEPLISYVTSRRRRLTRVVFVAALVALVTTTASSASTASGSIGSMSAGSSATGS